MLRIEHKGQPYDWFDLDGLGDAVKALDFAGTLRENIAHYFGVPFGRQVVFDEDGPLASDADFARALRAVRPLLRVQDVKEMALDAQAQTVKKLATIGAEAAKMEQLFYASGVGSEGGSGRGALALQEVQESAFSMADAVSRAHEAPSPSHMPNGTTSALGPMVVPATGGAGRLPGFDWPQGAGTATAASASAVPALVPALSALSPAATASGPAPFIDLSSMGLGPGFHGSGCFPNAFGGSSISAGAANGFDAHGVGGVGAGASAGGSAPSVPAPGSRSGTPPRSWELPVLQLPGPLQAPAGMLGGGMLGVAGPASASSQSPLQPPVGLGVAGFSPPSQVAQPQQPPLSLAQWQLSQPQGHAGGKGHLTPPTPLAAASLRVGGLNGAPTAVPVTGPVEIEVQTIGFSPPPASLNGVRASSQERRRAVQEIRAEGDSPHNLRVVEIVLSKDPAGQQLQRFGFANVPTRDGRSLLISWVDNYGLLAMWNRNNPDKNVAEGDRIVSVNGVADNVEAMRSQLQNDTIRMLVHRRGVNAC